MVFKGTSIADPEGKYHNGEPNFNAYWRTLIFDFLKLPLGGRRITPEDIEPCSRPIKSMLQVKSTFQSLLEWRKRPEPEPEPDLHLEILRTAISGRLQVGARAFGFGMIKDGYTAMFPEGTRGGDTLCVLFGSQTPHVIRQQNSSEINYEIVGPAYIRGLMDREATRMSREEY